MPSLLRNILRTSVLRFLHYDLQLFPYKIQILQSQTDHIKAERETFCENNSQRIENSLCLLDLIFFSGEAHCHWVGLSTSRIYASGLWAYASGPMNITITLLAKRKWLCCAIGRNGIIRSYFFEEQNEN